MLELCRRTGMPEDVTRELLRLHSDPDFRPDISCLTVEAQWEDGLKDLTAALGEDPRGMKLLCCMLRAASMASVSSFSTGNTSAPVGI